MDPVPCGPADVPRSGLGLSYLSHLVIYMLTVTDAATSMTKLPGPEDRACLPAVGRSGNQLALLGR